ncbi:MAG TPA: transposase [Fimbriimonadaceae bacterium]|nr:transposase [Fimbriimonadaceae bacterium]
MGSTYSNLLVHIVFATKGRVPVITDKAVHAYIGGIVKTTGATPIAVGGVQDHVHILALVKTSQNVSDLVREVKKGTSKWSHEKGARIPWQDGYAAISVGRRERDATVAYILNQEERHKRESSAEELRRLLEECGIEYDPRFFE